VSICSTGLSDIEYGLASVGPEKARAILDCNLTYLYALIDRGEPNGGLASYLDGNRRKIPLASIARYQTRLLAASAGDGTKGPVKLYDKIARASEAGLKAARKRRMQRARQLHAAATEVATT
jgi:hypothetical protein